VLLLCFAMTGVASAEVDGQAVGGFATNGNVLAVQEIGDRVFLGGGFTRAGPMTGPASLIDEATGAPVPGLPRVNGLVLDAEPDGAGGWYLAGRFDRVGRDERTNLAHVLANGTVDPAFVPISSRLDNQDVRTVALVGSRLLVGGDFTYIGGADRTGLAELDATGHATGWNPRIEGAVYALVPAGDRLYVAGGFQTIAGQPRDGLAALATADLAVTAWAPPIQDGLIFGVVPAGDRVYAAGTFHAAGEQRGFAAFAADDASLLPWHPAIGALGTSVAEYGDVAFLGGQFPAAQNLPGDDRLDGLVAVDRDTGVELWRPDLVQGPFDSLAGGQAMVHSLLIRNGHLLVAGRFKRVGTASRGNLARFDAATRTLEPWTSDSNGEVHMLAPAPGGRLIAGGTFSAIGMRERHALAAFDRDDFSLLPWDAQLTGDGAGTGSGEPGVLSLDTADGLLYAAGLFDKAAGVKRASLAALDPVSAAPEAWAPTAEFPVSGAARLRVAGDRVYVMNVDVLNGQPGGFLRAVSRSTGATLAWNPQPNLGVSAVEVVGDITYLGGNFSAVGGQTRYGAAAVRTSDGTVLPWNPDVRDADGDISGADVIAIHADGDRIHIAGRFASVGGQSHNGLAVVDRATAAPLPFGLDARYNGVITALAGVGSITSLDGLLYIGGSFTQLGTAAERWSGSAAFSPVTGQLASWEREEACSVSGPLVRAGASSLYAVSRPACSIYGVPFGDHVQVHRDTGVTPAARTAPQLAGPVQGQWLRCSRGTYTGNGPLRVTWQWLRDGAVISGTGFSGPDTHEIVDDDRAHALRCRTTATDGTVTIVQDSAPVDVPLAKPFTFQFGTLTVDSSGPAPVAVCGSGGWQGGAVQVEYDWLRDGIAVATGPRFTLVNPTPTTITCRVTAHNAAGSTSLIVGSLNYGGTASSGSSGGTQGTGGTLGPGSGPPLPPPDPGLQIIAVAPALSWAALLKKGARVDVRVNRGAALTVSLQLDPSTSRRAGLAAHGVTRWTRIARATGRLGSAGTTVIRLKPSRKATAALRRLRNHHRLGNTRLRAAITIRPTDGTQTGRRVIGVPAGRASRDVKA
jgi:hypothetical protein